jgi:hypothetical protein
MLAPVAIPWSYLRCNVQHGAPFGAQLGEVGRQLRFALVRARIPYVPVHVDQVDDVMGSLAVLMVPNARDETNGRVLELRFETGLRRVPNPRQ